MKHSGNKLALGTVQFGMNYGIANANGQVTAAEIKKVIGLAMTNGINLLDTAIGYGDSEKRLGEADVSGFEIVTKLPAIAADCTDIHEWVDQQIEGALQRLKVKQLYGVLFHVPSQLLSPGGNELYKALDTFRKNGVVGKIGVSVYSPDELSVLMGEFDFDIVQAPFNIIDRRLAESGWLGKLAASGKEVHIRSVFLQGLLLMNVADRAPYFAKWKSLFEKYEHWLQSSQLSAIQACLNYVSGFEGISKVLVGVDSSNNLQEIIDAILPDPISRVPDELASNDPNLIIPSNWKK